MVQFYRIQGSLAFVSILGSIVIIFSYFLMKNLRRHPTNLVCWLAICDLFFSLKYFITACFNNSSLLQNDYENCKLQALWSQFWGLASVSWNGLLALNLCLFFLAPFRDTSSLTKLFHFYVWSVSAATTIALSYYEKFGVSGDGTCWIDENSDVFQLLFFAPLVSYFVISIFSVLICLLSIHYTAEDDTTMFKLLFRLVFFSFVFIACWSMPIAHRIAVYLDKDNEVLQYLDGIGVSLQGFANAVIWLTNPGFYKAFKSLIADRILKFLRVDTDSIPLLSHLDENDLTDPDQDISRIDSFLRKEVITCFLFGISRTVSEHAATAPQKPKKKRRAQVKLPKMDGKDMNMKYQFTDYCGRTFQELRALNGIPDEDYLSSLNPGEFLQTLDDQKFTEGRSGSFFCFSPDKKFILKTIPPTEATTLTNILEDYKTHLQQHPDSLLLRFYGLHSLKVRYSNTVFVVVMGNIFSSSPQIHRRYDLKGSWVNRCKGKAHELNPSELGLDLDFKRKLLLDLDQKHSFLLNLDSDAKFLSSHGIMDYSLLIGIHENNPTSLIDLGPPPQQQQQQQQQQLQHHQRVETEDREIMLAAADDDLSSNVSEDPIRSNQTRWMIRSSDQNEIYVLGLIDVLQEYNFDKKLERFTKVFLLRKDAEGVSVISPERYYRRFISQISKIID